MGVAVEKIGVPGPATAAAAFSCRPKGEYNIGLPSQKSLFQLQVERVQRVKALAAAQAGVPVESVSLVRRGGLFRRRPFLAH